MRSININQSKPFIEKSDFNYIESIARSSYIARGQFVNKLEDAFCKIHNLKYACATSNGTTALHLALMALNIKQGDEVIIPSYSCVAVLNAVNYCGARAKIADIDPDTFNITYKAIRHRINRRTKAIIVIHTFGYPAAIDGIFKLGIPIIEDCAQALGARYKGNLVGSSGRISIFSLYATKMITCGEGGMLCTNDKKIIKKVIDLNTQDMREDYKIRYNYKMSELAAGLALNQLKRIDDFVKRRIIIAEKYHNAFARFPVTFQLKAAESEPCYYRFVICADKSEKIINAMQKQGIFCDKPVFKPLHHYFHGYKDKNFMGTDQVWEKAISIPIYPALKDRDVLRVINAASRILYTRKNGG